MADELIKTSITAAENASLISNDFSNSNFQQEFGRDMKNKSSNFPSYIQISNAKTVLSLNNDRENNSTNIAQESPVLMKQTKKPLGIFGTTENTSNTVYHYSDFDRVNVTTSRQ